MAQAVQERGTDTRVERLTRMRRLAGGLLLLMAALFLAASLAERRWSGAAYLRAFAEAAIVGGVADWFAVTALFRRPLGLPIPHTALVPRSKARIGVAFGRFFVENFLSARVLDGRLRALELAGWGGRWLAEPDVRRAILSLVPESDLLPVHEGQSFDYAAPLEPEVAYRLLLSAARSREPERLTVHGTVVDGGGVELARLETVLRLVAVPAAA